MTKNVYKIVGYHGTNENNVGDILKNGYTYNERDDHWLGQGIYFYTDIRLAKWFSVRKYKEETNKNLAVLKAVLSSDSDNVLNLDTVEGVDFVYQFIYDHYNDLKLEFLSEDTNLNRCMILDIIKEYHDLDIIIKTFKTKGQTYGKANVRFFEKNYFPLDIEYNETQICATNNNCIESSEKVVEAGDYKLPSRIWFEKKKR